MKLLIIGAGAIGTMLGVKLSLAGADVTFYDHPEILRDLSEKGMSLKVGRREYVLNNVKYLDSTSISRSGPFDLAVLCVKSYHTEKVCQSIPQGCFSQLLTIQNGVGNEEFLAQKFGAQCILAGVITLPVAVHGPGRVEITNTKGGLGLSSIRENAFCKDMKYLFERAGFDVRVYEDYREMKWSKLLLNIIGNATSAILDMSPVEIFDNRRLTSLEKQAFVEGLCVMKSLRLKLVELPGYPVRIIGIIFRHSPPTLLELIMSIQKSSSRGSKMPSLHIDLSAGSHYSEIEVLNGAIVKEARALGINVPVNTILYETLRGIVNGEIAWDRFRKKPDELWALQALSPLKR